MSKTRLGSLSAYKDAVAHGYTGSREDFGRDQANFAANAQAVADNLEESKKVLADVNTAGETQVGAVQGEGTAQIGNVGTAGDAQIERIAAMDAVSFDTAQSKTDAQKETARKNIDAASREEVDKISKEIGDVRTINLTGENTEFTLGKMIYSDGKEYNNVSLAITDYIEAIPGEMVRANHDADENGNVFTDFVCEYSSMSVDGFIRRTNIEKNGSVVLGEATKYIRFSFGRGASSGIEFTEADKAYFDVNIEDVDVNARIDRSNAELMDLLSGLAGEMDAGFLQTLHNRMEATSADSMDDLTNFGVYGWLASTAPYDCPAKDVGILVVYQYSKSNNPNYGRLTQTLYTTFGSYTRFRTTSSWSDWVGNGYLVNGDSIKLSAFSKKCLSEFIPSKDLETASSAVPVFTAGNKYSGVPYSSIQALSTDAFFNMSLSALFSMFSNPYSAIYTYENKLGGATSKVYAGGVCSSFTCWITGQPIFYTTYDIFKMLDYKTINDIEDIEIGDVMLCHQNWKDDENHSMVISNIVSGINGITAVEISEMWPPVFRRVLYTKKQFLGLLDGTTRSGNKYRIGRFPNTKIRTVPPVVINRDIITEFGDDAYFEYGDDVYITSTNTNIRIKSPTGVESTVDFTSFPLKENTTMRNVTSALNETGRWTLYGTNNEESHITIIKKGDVTLENDTVSVNGYEGCTPCGYATIVIRDDGVGDYETHLESTEYTASRLTIYLKEDPRYAGAMDGDGVTIDISKLKNSYVGYYVRVFYDTGCGQAHKDSNIVYF